jgi:hypothetical protein
MNKKSTIEIFEQTGELNYKIKETESVRIDSEVLAKVREVVKKTKQSIGGFISLEMEKVADRKLKSRTQSQS